MPFVARDESGTLIAVCAVKQPEFAEEWLDEADAAIQAWRHPLPTQVDYVKAVGFHIDAVAQSRGYDDIKSAATYVTSKNPTFKAEAAALIAWRDDVWAFCFAQLAAVQSGQEQQPAVAAFVATLPVITW